MVIASSKSYSVSLITFFRAPLHLGWLLTQMEVESGMKLAKSNS
jgi:hypothetical protein